jgi:steroid 5-alpha reductase family enzyme
MLMLVFAVLIAMAVVMLSGWVVQRAAKNGGWTDVFWTYGTGLTCAAAALATSAGLAGVGWRQALVALMLAVWSLRLGTYVALRVIRSPEDVRYSEMRHEWGTGFQRNMFGLLIIQAPITALISVSVILAAHHPAAGLRWQDILGVAIFLAALIGESVADRQMKAFKADAANHGKVCDRGLWGLSRHPNYFFEALIWWAYPVMAFDAAQPWTAAALVAPVLMYAIVRYLTGVPPLEAAMVRSKGEAYRRYQARVSVLAPWPRRHHPSAAS